MQGPSKGQGAEGVAERFQKSTAREYFESIIIAVILALFIRTFVVQAFKIPTGSMEENLLIGDHLLVNKFAFVSISSASERALQTNKPGTRGDIVAIAEQHAIPIHFVGVGEKAEDLHPFSAETFARALVGLDD